MRKAVVIICSLFILTACNSKKENPKPTISPRVKAIPSAADSTMYEWLKAKIWTAENDNAPMSLLKLKSDGGYELKSAKNPGTWQILGGNIGLDKLTEWPIEKMSDSAFRLYVKPTDKWYTYKLTGRIE